MSKISEWLGNLFDTPQSAQLSPEKISELAKGIDLWAYSPERDEYFKRRWRSLVWLAPAFALLLFGAWLLRPNESSNLIASEGSSRWWAFVALFCSVLITFWVSVPYCAARASFRERARGMATYRVRSAIDDLANAQSDEIPLTKLFKLNRSQLDEYQQTTKRQQKSSFKLAQVTSVAGFLILLFGSSTFL